jgi:hypothetical protein
LRFTLRRIDRTLQAVAAEPGEDEQLFKLDGENDFAGDGFMLTQSPVRRAISFSIYSVASRGRQDLPTRHIK